MLQPKESSQAFIHSSIKQQASVHWLQQDTNPDFTEFIQCNSFQLRKTEACLAAEQAMLLLCTLVVLQTTRAAERTAKPLICIIFFFLLMEAAAPR